MVTRRVRSLPVLSAFAAILCAGCASGPPGAEVPLAGPLPLEPDAVVARESESFGEEEGIVPPDGSAGPDASAEDDSEVDALCDWGPVPTSPAWEAIVAALGSAHEAFALCRGEFCSPDRPPCERWDIAFLPPGENGAPRMQIRRSESNPDGSWGVEGYELSPYGYPCNDGIDVLCVQWEGCGPTEAVGLGWCSSGCPSMERYYVRSSRPGVVEFEWYDGTRTFYSSLDDCLAEIGRAAEADAAEDVAGAP